MIDITNRTKVQGMSLRPLRGARLIIAFLAWANEYFVDDSMIIVGLTQEHCHS
jgi:hypothetical protein